ncbi:undecaprenyl-phosphate glucose phosphotransferase [Flavobacteriaceae bacterium R38]|nr:undecaprenyl-phosphate glucose phosphotransferase [Flavobacteriaceae bacterium R38]
MQLIKGRGRYSRFIKPVFYVIDLTIVNLTAFLLPIDLKNRILFFGYITLFWMLIALRNQFYEVYRYSKVTLVLSLLFRQFSIFFLILYAFIGFFKEFNISRLLLAEYCLIVFFLIAVIKLLAYFLLIKYRRKSRGNHRRVIVIGKNKKTDQLIEIFNSRLEFGYEFKQQFSLADDSYSLTDCFNYVIQNEIDEIYCSVSELTNKNLEDIINFADNNLRIIKFLPDNRHIYTKRLKFEYYDYLPILSLRDIPLEGSINSFIKRAFDILFSSLIIVFVLSWLTPLIAILIRLESKGPIFFRQYRNGINSKEFACYKFRSMAMNKAANLEQAKKGDARITRIGKFIRKTSIDELPQFFNVFYGHMSVVGPRPHMVVHTEKYSRNVDKYMVRHFVRPGITGLAQVKGYRGEIEAESDIINRVKFDIFYIENWTLFLDLKIIVQTVLNALKGEEKAY